METELAANATTAAADHEHSLQRDSGREQAAAAGDAPDDPATADGADEEEPERSEGGGHGETGKHQAVAKPSTATFPVMLAVKTRPRPR